MADTLSPLIQRFANLSVFPDLRHGIFARHHGISPFPFDSLNVGLGIGDSGECVRKNRETIIDAMGGGHPVFLNQVHGNTVLTIKNPLPDGPPVDVNGSAADGVITDLPGLLLFIQVADCQPVLLYDPVRNVVGNVHSGWRSSLLNIIGTAVRTMVREFGSRPEDIRAGIGPSLGPCCCEFINYRREIPEAFWKYRIAENHFDFWAISRTQLTEEGILDAHIEINGTCTRCHPETWFSYRHRNKTGRFASVIGRMTPS